MDQEITAVYIEKLKQNLFNITNQYIVLEAQFDMINKSLEEAKAKIKSLENSLVDTKSSKKQ